VLDLGSGAGTDSLVAAQMVGEQGHVTGIDMIPEMLAKARTAAAEMGAANVRVRRERGGAAAVPGRELRRRDLERRDRPDPGQGRRLRRDLPRAHPGGRIQIADVTIQNPVSAEGRRNIDLWTG
jgi:SAM-dependent methyltransferase